MRIQFSIFSVREPYGSIHEGLENLKQEYVRAQLESLEEGIIRGCEATFLREFMRPQKIYFNFAFCFSNMDVFF